MTERSGLAYENRHVHVGDVHVRVGVGDIPMAVRVRITVGVAVCHITVKVVVRNVAMAVLMRAVHMGVVVRHGLPSLRSLGRTSGRGSRLAGAASRTVRCHDAATAKTASCCHRTRQRCSRRFP